jgi:hypothetical protein
MSPGDWILVKGREGHAEKVDVFFGNDACNRSADVKCVNGSPAWLLSNTLTAQVTSFLPAIFQNAPTDTRGLHGDHKIFLLDAHGRGSL